MSKPRQAQQEIEKKLQQVEEGYANFQSIWKKFQSANSSVKEKLETEMQKEIKRFQGIKEALKGVDSLEPRFKARINDAKKKIEDVIEFHKQIERDSKVKVISKEPPVSLKNDQQEEKEELRQALRSFLASFQEKVTVRESEIEKCKNSKMRISMVDDLNRQIRVLRYHSDKTEAVLKQIDSDSVHPNFVWNLCEKFEIFLKSEDIAEDDQEIEHAYKDIGINSKPLKNFPSLNDDEHQPHKRSNSKKQDNKPVGRTGDKAVEKAWNSKENLFKSAWKQEKVTEDLPDEDIKNEICESETTKKMMDFAYSLPMRYEERAKSSIQILLTPSQGHPSFPKKPLFGPAFFKKYEEDTLFFIFYHQQGTYQQYLAAKELKMKGWLYHKRFQSWFLRQGDPKLSAADREKGSFMYFDYETSWAKKKKNEFEFEYSFLEND